MASTGVDYTGSGSPPVRGSSDEKKKDLYGDPINPEAASLGSAPGDHTKRQLKSRHIQLIGS
jgi:hypothetical protein